MASRYSQEYFFQHSLMNMSFTDPNEIIHPNAESIPEYIRHFASAMFVNESFWNNSNAITEELQMERNTDNYISTYLSYINMLQTTYNLVTKGKIFFSRFYCYHHINFKYPKTTMFKNNFHSKLNWFMHNFRQSLFIKLYDNFGVCNFDIIFETNE